MASVSSFAQVPQKFSSQMVIRNTLGDLVSESNVQVRVTIVQGSIGGTEEFQELHTPFTNSNGLASFEIGAGNPINGTMDMIDWANGPYFIRTEVDPSNTSNFSIVGTMELLAVPYALHAGSDGDWDDDGDNVHTLSKNVGIGTDNPLAKLEVFGADAKIHGLTVGRGPGGEFGNTVLGATVMVDNQSGGYTTAIGNFACSENLTASYSTAVGYSALSGNSEGEFNTAIGAGAMGSFEMGNYNTALGFNAFIASPSYDNSTAIGANSVAEKSNCVILGSNADVGIKTSYPHEELEVGGDGRAFFGDGEDSNRKGLLIDGIEGDNAARIEAYNYGSSTGMNLVLNTTSTSGFVGIRRTDPTVSLDVSGSIEYTGTITDVSDERLKENFKSIENAVESISKLQGYSYNMIDDEDQVREYGVKAQEVQKVFPEMVTVVDTKEGYLGVSYIQLIPVLIEAIKELKEENELLRAEHVIQSELIKSNTQLMVEMKKLLSSSAQH
jgi:hypothetical protein